MARYSKAEVFQRVPARLGEGPCWHPARKTFWWIDILGQKYFEVDLKGGAPRVLPSAQMIGAVVPTQAGGMLAALGDGIYLLDPDTGATTLFASAPGHDAKQFRFNDAKVDPRGRFFAGTLALDDRPGQSRLYRIDPDRSVHVMREGVSISNGLAWSPDQKTLYYIDSPTRQVQAFDYDIETGRISRHRIAITLGEADGWPDGCCMDVEGGLWIGHWGASKMTRWDPAAGRLLGTVQLPVSNVTSCCFGGEKLDQLFITTAVDDSRAGAEPEAGFVFRLDPGVKGLALAGFAGR